MSLILLVFAFVLFTLCTFPNNSYYTRMLAAGLACATLSLLLARGFNL